jgi:glycosyltransferase involved in cell wall biosynthesis
MHVLVVNNIYPPIMAGGAELIVSYLAEGLAGAGHRVSVVSTCGPEMEPYPPEQRNGVEIFRYFPPNLYWSFSRNRGPGFEKVLWHMRDAWNRQAGVKFRALLQKLRPDVLHTHVIDGMSATIWDEARRMGIPVIHTAHDYHLLCPRAFLLTQDWKLCNRPSMPCRVYRGWHLDTARHVDLFASPSRFLLGKHEQAGLRVGDRAVVHNGIPLPVDMAQVRSRRVPESRKRFLMLTRLTVEKGVEVVLKAIRRLPADLDIEVAIAGKGPLEDEVRRAAQLDRRITYLGYLDGDAKRAALSRAGYLLLPSLWYENAPVAIVEAAAYGLGLIGSDIGGIPEFVEPGRTGFLFPPGDVPALAALMTQVAKDADIQPSLAPHSLALAQRFAAERMVENYQAHYEELLDRRAAVAAQ